MLPLENLILENFPVCKNANLNFAAHAHNCVLAGLVVYEISRNDDGKDIEKDMFDGYLEVIGGSLVNDCYNRR